MTTPLVEESLGTDDRLQALLRALEREEKLTTWETTAGRQWHDMEMRFVQAVHPQQRAAMGRLVERLPSSSLGLHVWLCTLAWDGAFLPESLPWSLIQVYLEDPEAFPMGACSSCGLALPMHPHGDDFELVKTYFPTCPHCGCSCTCVNRRTFATTSAPATPVHASS